MDLPGILVAGIYWLKELPGKGIGKAADGITQRLS
jgi:hypothetical protein